MTDPKAGRELDADIAERVMGEILSVPRERAMAIVGACYVRETGAVFKLDVHGYDVSVRMPPSDSIAGHESDPSINARYFRHAVAELLTYPNEIGELVEADIAACRLVPRPYSTSIADAWLVVEKMRADGIYIDVRSNTWGYSVIWARAGVDHEDIWVVGERFEDETAPLAICRAALAALRAVEHAQSGVTNAGRQ